MWPWPSFPMVQTCLFLAYNWSPKTQSLLDDNVSGMCATAHVMTSIPLDLDLLNELGLKHDPDLNFQWSGHAYFQPTSSHQRATITLIRLAKKVVCVPLSMQWPNDPLTSTHVMTLTLIMTLTFISNGLDMSTFCLQLVIKEAAIVWWQHRRFVSHCPCNDLMTLTYDPADLTFTITIYW